MAGIVLLSCNNDKEEAVVAPVKNVTKKEVIENYANIAYENYKKAYDDAVILKSAITTFTTTPTQVNFDNAKNKWKVARESYGTTEAFRFANGPIDNTTGPESFLNSWPLDENFIDYVNGAPNAGIVNNEALFPIITKSVLKEQNELGGEKTYL
ncbi:lipoprotein precursor [Flavobacterium psychrophilum]|nr:lipoprotein precursor [Flavobacterium psychrophilum]